MKSYFSTQIEAERFRKKYIEKIELRCEEQMTKMTWKCRNAFSKAYDWCYEAVTWLAAWILCWPMKLTFVCNIGQIFGNLYYSMTIYYILYALLIQSLSSSMERTASTKQIFYSGGRIHSQNQQIDR